MRNLKKPLMGLAVLMTSISLLTGCGGGKLSETEKIVREASKMSYQELVAKAKEEVGDNTVLTFGNSSQFAKALEKFTEETGIKVENSKKGDAETYTELGEAFAAGRYIADMVLLQDGNKLQTEMLNNDYLVNFIPKDVNRIGYKHMWYDFGTKIQFDEKNNCIKLLPSVANFIFTEMRKMMVLFVEGMY